MHDALRLSFTPDENGEGELLVEVLASGFSGRSSIWIAAQALSAFALALEQAYPLSADRPIELVGGYQGRDRDPGLRSHIHARLAVYPIGARGDVGIGVHLATPLRDEDRPESQSRVSVELCTHYETLTRFARAILNLSEGRADEAVLGEASEFTGRFV